MAEHGGDARKFILEAVASLDDLDLPETTRTVLPLLLKALGYRRDGADLAGWIRRFREDLRRVHDALGVVAERLELAELEATGAGRVDGAWWRARQQELRTLLESGSTATATTRWIGTWSRALAVDEFELCEDIASFGEDWAQARLVAALREVSVPLQFGPAVDALAPLDTLLADSGVELEDDVAITLGAFQIRLMLEDGDRERAAQSADLWVERAQAQGVALDADIESRPVTATLLARRYAGARSLALCVRAEVDFERDDLDAARDNVNEAMSLAAGTPDVYILASVLAEQDGAWSRADEYCDEALAHGAEPGKVALLRPLTSRLLVRAAHQRRTNEPSQAVELLERALDFGITGDGEYPEAEVHLAKAEILVELGQLDEAASAYAAAGNCYVLSDLLDRGIDCLRRACDLGPSSPEPWWWYAEALRLSAVERDGVVDLGRMRAAARAMDSGTAQTVSEGVPGWALVVQALIAEELPELDLDVAVLIERAMLLGDREPYNHLFLANHLRRQGFIQEAYEVAEQGHGRYGDDNDLLECLGRLLADQRRYGEGLELVEPHLVAAPGDAGLSMLKATQLLRLQRPAEAVETLQAADSTDWVRSELALSYAANDQSDRARQEFDSLWREVQRDGSPDLVGWVAFRSGHLEEAIQLVGERAARAPEHLTYLRDLGQMRLVRGDEARDDLVQGEQLLRRGIAAATAPDQLVELRVLEFNQVRREVAGKPHEDRVAAVLELLDPEIEQRCEHLLGARRAPTSLGARLAAARTAIQDGKPEMALEEYRQLATAGLLGAQELAAGAQWAGSELLDVSDDRTRQGSHADANRLLGALAAAPLPEGDPLGGEIAARQAVMGFVLGDSVSARHALARALEHDEAPIWLSAATSLYDASNLRSRWLIVEGLNRAASDGPWDRQVRAFLTDVARELLQRIFRVSPSELPPVISSPRVTALEVRLGAAHADLASSAELNEGIPELRRTLTKEMGVRIQGTRVSIDQDQAPEHVEFLLFAETVAVIPLDPGAGERGVKICAELKQALLPQLYRLLGPDDIGLWLSGWSAKRRSAELWDPADPRATLRLARVLRRLLRERVPIVDRAAIVRAFRRAESLDSSANPAVGWWRARESSPASGSGPLGTLRAVRLALGAQTLGWRTDDLLCPLPAVLEAWAAAGLDSTWTRWEMPRTELHRLIGDLHSWVDTECLGRSVIIVRNPWIRPYLWRLLANQRTSRPVLAEEELP